MVVKKENSLSCESCNLTDCAYCILNLVRQDLMQADDNSPSFSRGVKILTQLKNVFAHLGVIVVTYQAEMLFITQQGEQLLKQYFPSYTPNSLPESLQYWLKYQISLFTAQDKVPNSYLPLQLEQGDKQLVIRLISELISGQYLFLLEEEPLPSLSINTLQLLPISNREPEVLFWVAKDKCNAGIARILGCSEGTVGKHLEHLYKKLGVQTRTGAVVEAMERLGLLKGQFVAIRS